MTKSSSNNGAPIYDGTIYEFNFEEEDEIKNFLLSYPEKECLIKISHPLILREYPEN